MGVGEHTEALDGATAAWGNVNFVATSLNATELYFLNTALRLLLPPHPAFGGMKSSMALKLVIMVVSEYPDTRSKSRSYKVHPLRLEHPTSILPKALARRFYGRRPTP